MSPDQQVSYRQLFPWLHLFQAIRLAAAIRQLLISIAAVFVLGAGQTVIDWFKPGRNADDGSAIVQESLPIEPIVEINMSLLGSPHFTLTPARAGDALRPWAEVVRSLIESLNREQTIGFRWIATGQCLWSVAVWSFFGLIIGRLAARRLALDDDGSIRKSTQFGATRWQNAIVSPLLPTAAASLMLGMAIVASLPGRLPYVGWMFVVIASPFVLGVSLVAALLIVATAIGWPLMISAIAYEDCDGFGGLSRSYSLWTGRPWQFVWYWIVTAIAGTLAMFLIGFVGTCTLNVAGFVVRSGMGGSPEVLRTAKASADFLIGTCLAAYGISFFWTSATIIYALLRRSVDCVPMSVVAPDEDEKPIRDPLPVVGIPAVEEKRDE